MFVSVGWEVLVFFECEGVVKYSLCLFLFDYYLDEFGVVDVGCVLEVVEYDGCELGDVFCDLCLLLLGMLLFGGMMVNCVDI